jgi:hypothetical protein
MDKKTILSSAIVALLTSVVVCGIFFLIIDKRLKGSGDSLHQDTLSSKESPAGKTPADTGTKTGDAERAEAPDTKTQAESPQGPGPGLDDLKADLEKLKSEVQKLSDSTGKPLSRQEAARKAFKELVSGKSKSQVLISDLINRIVLGGKETIPLITEYLASGKQVDFGGSMSTSGGLMKSFPDLKTALAYSLFSMEDKEAKDAYFTYLKTGAELPVLSRLLNLHRQLPEDAQARAGLREALVRGAQMLSNVDEAPDITKNYYGLLHFMNANVKNLEASAAVPHMVKALKGDVFDWSFKRSLLQSVSSMAPDTAADIIIEQYRDEEERKKHPITAVTTNFNAHLPSSAKVIEKVLSSGVLTQQERMVLFSGAGQVVRFAFRMKKVDQATARSQLEKWAEFLRGCEAAETDEMVQGAIHRAIRAAEGEIKKRK